MTARYESLSGGRSMRAIHYLAQRHLSLSADEWDGLPWHRQRMLVDGLAEEGLVHRDDSSAPADPNLVDERRHRSGNTTLVDRTYRQVGRNEPGEFASMGIPERTLP